VDSGLATCPRLRAAPQDPNLKACASRNVPGADAFMPCGTALPAS